MAGTDRGGPRRMGGWAAADGRMGRGGWAAACQKLMPADPLGGPPVGDFAYGLSTVGAPLLRLLKLIGL